MSMKKTTYKSANTEKKWGKMDINPLKRTIYACTSSHNIGLNNRIY